MQPAAVSDILAVIGPITIEVDGGQRLVTAQNVYDEIERPRRLGRQGQVIGIRHKQLLALIGTEILKRLRQADRSTLLKLVPALRDVASRRDVQLYSADPAVQELFDRYGWTGRLQPESHTPTFALALANLVTNKRSLALKPSLDLELKPLVGGHRGVKVTLTLANTATNADDLFYSGVQRWWIELTFPERSRLLHASKPAAPDPEAPNGNSYVMGLFPQQRDRLTVEFQMPAVDVLLLRCQPGAQPLTVSIQG